MKQYYKISALIILLAISCVTIFYSISINTSNPYAYQLKLYQKYEHLTYEEIEKIPKKDRPDLAAMQEFEMTMDPSLGYPPVERKIEAFAIAKKMLQNKNMETSKAIAGVQWQERGPNNVGGRTRALMFDPNDATNKKVWAGGIGGGLWYNNDITNIKSSWTNVNSVLSNIAISTISYDPTNTTTYYLGTGLGFTGRIRGAGIWISIDAGANWSQLASTTTSNFYHVNKIKVTAQGIVFAATNTGLMKSVDNGTSWSNVLNFDISDLEIASDGTIYATKGHISSSGIYKSVDNGVNWTDISPIQGGFRVELASSPSNPNVLYAVADLGSGENDIAWIKKSTDSGTSWNDISIPIYLDTDCNIGTTHFTRGQAWFDLILAVHPDDPNTIIAGGIDLHKSQDGGANWQAISYWTGSYCDDYVHADQHEIVFRPNYPDQAIFGNDGGVFYSADVGNNLDPEFESRNNGYNVTTFYSVAAANEINSNTFLAGAQDNGTQLFSNPGINSTIEATGGDGGYCFIDQDNPNIMITSYVYNSYLLSTDRGKSFISLSSDQNSSGGRFINPTEYDSDADILYGTGDVDEITRISGITTTPTALERVNIDLTNRKITTIKASPYTSNRLFVGTRVYQGEGLIFMIDNANTASPTVTPITGTFESSTSSVNDRPGGWVSSIDVGNTDGQLLATFSNYGVHSVYETTDGGLTWKQKGGNLPDMPIRWGLYNPNNRNQALLATEVGVWSTDDLSVAAPVWEPTNSGLDNVRVDMLKYRTSDQMVIIATFGRGLYTTDIFVNQADANFHTEQTIAYVGVPVSFNDASINANNSWSWNFGDGIGVSTNQNPTYTYLSAGVYDVSLSIDNSANTETKIGHITVLPVKTTPYTAIDGGNFESNPNDYTSKSLLGGINHWERGVPANRLITTNSGTNAWKTKLNTDIIDVGFNYKSALYTPAFDLSANSGDYTLRFRKSMENAYCNSPHAMQLQYSTDGGVNWYRLGGSTSEYGAINWYNAASNLGCSLEQEVFTDKTGWVGTNTTDLNTSGIDNSVDNENTEYKLNFLAGEPNVSFRFVSAVSTGSGAGAYDRDGFMIDDFEILVTPASAEFEANVTTSFINETISFSYLSNGATSYNWDFGDGTTSTIQNPTHIYTASGTYTVSLSIDGAADVITKTNYITILPNKTPPYLTTDGGNFDINQSHFSVDNVSGTPFELGNSTVAGKDGTASGSFAWVTGLTNSNYLDGTLAHLLSPSFDFSSPGDYTLSFKAKYQLESEGVNGAWDSFWVEYSLNFGNNWSKLGDDIEAGWYNQKTHPSSDVNSPNLPVFSGTSSVFEIFSKDVTSLYGNSSVIFRFVFMTDNAATDVGLAIDDFELGFQPASPAVPNFTYQGNSGCDGQVVTFTNQSTGFYTGLNWDFGANATPATATGEGPHSVTYSGTGTSSVALTTISPINGNVTETKVDIISSSPSHTPTFTEEKDNDYTTYKLVASAGGDAYQWYYNGQIITGATNQIYIATESELGIYSVEITVGGCTQMSSGLNIISGSEEPINQFKIFPNPTFNGIFNVESKPNSIITIYNSTGKVVYLENSIKSTTTIDLCDHANGMYIVEIINDKEIKKQRINIMK